MSRKAVLTSIFVVVLAVSFLLLMTWRKPPPLIWSICKFEFALVPADNVTSVIVWHHYPENLKMGIGLKFDNENIEIKVENLSSNKVYSYSINRKIEYGDLVRVWFYDAYTPTDFAYGGIFWGLEYKVGDREIVEKFAGGI